MERSTASLTYKGSITDAIGEAQRQKKLFLVYISGEDENSINLERSTWVDLHVAESVSKYCVFLHLIQGSLEASQFSAIYSQKFVPSITAVGYNGLLLWQHDGYINAEGLVVNIEKAWATIHLQETAATFLSATLPSNNLEPLGSSSHDVSPVETIVSSTLDIPSSSGKKSLEGSEEGTLTNSEKLGEQQFLDDKVDQKDVKLGEEICSRLVYTNDANIDMEDQSNPGSPPSEVQHSASMNVENSGTCNAWNVSDEPQENPGLDVQSMVSPESAVRKTKFSSGSSQITATEVEERISANKFGSPADSSNSLKTDNIHFNIRFPNGTSRQVKFVKTDTLRTVRNYIDKNDNTGIGSYDLAVPYPRKVFDEQDMNHPLSDLGFAGREALVIVPHKQATRHPRHQVSSNDGQNDVSSTDPTNDGGYFEFVKRMLSYANPFSYFGGRTDPSQTAPNESIWEYRPNPGLQNQLPRVEASHSSDPSSNRNPEIGDNVNTMRRRTSRPFGSNIHTLRHDEDGPSGDRNTFWNGNSTQYGGNDN